MKILVTGCCGYIGSVLCDYLLQKQYTVMGIDNFMYNNQQSIYGLLGHPRFKFLYGDVRTLPWNTYSEYDVIVPLAAIVGAPACERRPLDAMGINHRAIQMMAGNISREQRIVYPNTNSGYGTQGEKLCTEESELRPISTYGVTKCEAEKIVLDHQNSAVLRLATVAGASPRMRFDLMVNDFTAKLFYAKQKSSTFKIFEPHYQRNFVHVRDVARAFAHMISRYDLKGIYNLGNPSANMTKMELAHRICDTIGVDKNLVTVGDGRDPDQRNYLVSNDKILTSGFVFKHPIEQAVTEAATICSMHPSQEIERMSNK